MTNKLNISFVTQNLAPFRLNWLRELSKYYYITVYHNNEYDKTFNMNSLKNINVGDIKIYMIKNKIFNKIPVYNFFKIFSNKYDILILDGYGFWSQILLIMILKIFKKNYIVSLDGGLIREEKKLKKLCKSFIIKGATYYLSTSSTTDLYLIHYGIKYEKILRHKLSSVYNNDILKNPVCLEKKQKLRIKYKITKKNVIIGIGRFIPIKGFDILIKAMKNIKETELILVGGVLTEEYNAIIKANKLSDVVTFINHVSKEEVIELLDLSDVFVLPTRGDVWGLVINEAMARGLPIITTNKCVAGVSLIENNKNGFIVEVDNLHELQEKINYLLLNDDIRLQMSKNNLKKIKNYSLEHIAIEDKINLSKYFY